MISIREQERRLFDAWREQMPSIEKAYIEDGVVDEDRFLQQKWRYVFVLKEANDLNMSLVDFLKTGAPGNGGHTWNPVCRWLMGIDSREFSQEERAEILRNIAVVNLKKENRQFDGAYTTNHSHLEKVVERDRQWLKKQFEIYAKHPPVVFVCCGPGLLTMISHHLFDDAIIQRDSVLPFMQPDANRKVLFVAFNHPNAKKRGLTAKFKAIQNMIDSVLTSERKS